MNSASAYQQPNTSTVRCCLFRLYSYRDLLRFIPIDVNEVRELTTALIIPSLLSYLGTRRLNRRTYQGKRIMFPKSPIINHHPGSIAELEASRVPCLLGRWTQMFDIRVVAVR